MNSKVKVISFPQISKIVSAVNWVNKNRVSKLDQRKYPIRVIEIDLAKMKKIKPYHISPLACLIHEYKEKGYKIKLKNVSPRLELYLSSFNFKAFCEGSNEVNNFPKPINITTLPLWRIEEEAATLYHKQVQSYFENNLIDDKELSSLCNSLGELMNNVFDHSESKIPGFTFTQLDTVKKEIITSVCDFGVGIPRKVNRYLKKINEESLSDTKAIERALVNKFTTKSTPRNRGFGLYNTLTGIKEYEGKMLIISGKAFFWQLADGSHIYRDLDEYFQGTLIVIYLSIDKLPKKEIEFNDEMHAI